MNSEGHKHDINDITTFSAQHDLLKFSACAKFLRPKRLICLHIKANPGESGQSCEKSITGWWFQTFRG